MDDISFLDSAISELLKLKEESPFNSSLRNQINDLLSGLVFMQLYAQCLAKWNEALQGKKNKHLGTARNLYIKAKMAGATKGLYSTGTNALATQDFQDWDKLASNLLKRIHDCKPEIEKETLSLLDLSFQCRFSSFELQMFFRNLFDSLDRLLGQNSEKAVDIKNHICEMQQKLRFLAQIFQLSRKIRSNSKDLKDFILRIQSWAYDAACLSLLYWVGHEDREEVLRRKRIFLLTPRVTRMFLEVLKHLWSKTHNHFLTDEGVPVFVDFLLEIVQLLPSNGIQNLRSELMFFTAFLINPPTAEEYTEEAESIANDVQNLFCSLNPNQETGGTAKDFHENMNAVKAKVREFHASLFLDSSSFEYPKSNVLGFLDSLIDNLKEISIHKPSHQHNDILDEDLLSLAYYFKKILTKIEDVAEAEELRKRITDVVYRIKIAANMRLHLNDCDWYDMKFLTDLRENIKLVKSEVEKIKSLHFPRSTTKVSNVKMGSNPFLCYLSVNEVVGFSDELEIIINQLTSGSPGLEIVSIVGAAGQGKTTLAKMAYRHASVKNHFDILVGCCVSPSYQIKDLLLDILRNTGGLLSRRSRSSTVAEKDLEGSLHKLLKGRRYLIVLDDMWHIRAWNDLKLSFPDCNNGSRILITSRNSDMPLEMRHDCIIHQLRPLSPEESWELLEKKVYGRERCPVDLQELGKRIALNCDGNPYVLGFIARYLISGNVKEWGCWNYTAERQDFLIREAVRAIVELSYRDLPEYLKPCLLYFAGFHRDKLIRARRLIQLWVSEGLIRESDRISLENVAMDYLFLLVSRSLVVVADRSSSGGIKTCQIESMCYEYCIAKAEEEKFLHVENLDSNSTGAIYKHYRTCIKSKGDEFFNLNPYGPCVHSLLFQPDDTWLDKGDLFSICNFKLLQVLDLEDIELIDSFPEEAIQLVLLRYLAIWCPYGILSVPQSISELKYLETLRVIQETRSGDEMLLPDTLWKMKRLRHLDVGGFILSFSADPEPNEKSLALENIQTFSAPSLTYGDDAEKLVRRLPNVQKLGCQFNDSYDPYQKQNRFPALDALTKLESLNLRYAGSFFHSCSISLPLNLKKLTLAQFKLPWTQMTMLQSLPNLEILKLLKDACDGEEWEIEDKDVFLKLKFLKLCGLNIARWRVVEEVFPHLKQLIVQSCPELEEIPLQFGNICTLEKIQIRLCKSTVAISARQIAEVQEDCGNSDFQVLVMDTLN